MARRRQNIKHTGIAVAEGHWFDGKNTSIRGLFDLLSDIHCGTPHGYHFDKFCDRAALNNIVGQVAVNDRLKYLYIASHGGDGCISGTDGTEIKLRQIKDAFKDWRNRTIDGVFLGSCLIGQADNLAYLLNPPVHEHKPPFVWIAGYETVVDWMRSSVLDLLFWQTLLELDHCAENDSLERLPKIRKAAKTLAHLAPGLIADLGFQIYIRRNGGAQPLLDPHGAALAFALDV